MMAAAAWCCYIGLAAILGGILSFCTGYTEEIPKWNGWSYLIFSMKEGAMLGIVLTCPAALIVFFISYFSTRSETHTRP